MYKDLEFVLPNANYHISFNFLLILLSIEQGSVFETDSGKKDLNETFGPGHKYQSGIGTFE